MLALLSPAKKLDFSTHPLALPTSVPVLQNDMGELVRVVKQKSALDLQKLMGISEALASLNAERFAQFSDMPVCDALGRTQTKAAAFSFNGEVYEGFDAKSLSVDELAYAQEHVRILSGLYGVLHPLDAIQPYRLEMGTRLATSKGKNLYAYWEHKIADVLCAHLETHKENCLVNLASQEYFKAVSLRGTQQTRVISVQFLEIKDGKARALMYYAKRARGMFARWMVQNCIEKADDLLAFAQSGYGVDVRASTENNLVFTRIQPPTKSTA